MAKYELKTKKNAGNVKDFIDTIDDPVRKKDAKKALTLMKKATGKTPVMWGSSIVGFGTYTYTDSGGKEHEWMMTGFSPRKAALTFYIMPGYQFPKYKKLLKELGPHTTGKSCLYIKHLEDINLKKLEQLVKESLSDMKKKYTKTKK